MNEILANINKNLESIWGNTPVIPGNVSSIGRKGPGATSKFRAKNIQNSINRYQLSSPNYFILFVVLGYFVVNLYSSNQIQGDSRKRMDTNQLATFRYNDLLLVIALSIVTYSLTNFRQSGLFYLGFFIGLIALFVVGYQKSRPSPGEDDNDCPPLDPADTAMSFDFTSFVLFLMVCAIVIINLFNAMAGGTAMVNQYLIIVITVVLAFLTIIRKDQDRLNYILDWDDEARRQSKRQSSKGDSLTKTINHCEVTKSGRYITLNVGTFSWLVSLLFIPVQGDATSATINMFMSMLQGLFVGLYVSYFAY